mmetsp:Transcript_29786/g.74982  ORF Transcript_29786/g.74982 Transcript_29786/m.74982 type:complete len:110 (-) Transcript_29786:945-1274(-)
MPLMLEISKKGSSGARWVAGTFHLVCPFTKDLGGARVKVKVRLGGTNTRGLPPPRVPALGDRPRSGSPGDPPLLAERELTWCEENSAMNLTHARPLGVAGYAGAAASRR